MWAVRTGLALEISKYPARWPACPTGAVAPPGICPLGASDAAALPYPRARRAAPARASWFTVHMITPRVPLTGGNRTGLTGVRSGSGLGR